MTTATLDREAWLTERKTAIGASDAPAALGISPWKSKFALWAEKTGLAEPEEISNLEAAEFGLRLERPIAEAFADRTGRTVNMWPEHRIVRDPDRPWLACTPDAVQHTGRGIGGLQIKTASAYKASEWADGPPLIYMVQCQQEMHINGWDWETLAVLIGGNTLRWFDLERNDRFINEALLPKLAEFWKCVEDRTPPEVDSSLATVNVLRKLHPLDSGAVIELPPDSDEWAEKLAEAKAAKKAAEELEALAGNHLRAMIGDATEGVTPSGRRFTWKRQEEHHTAKPAKVVVKRVLREVK